MEKKLDLLKKYKESSNVYESRYYDIQKNKFELLREFFCEVDFVLEIGCGTGLLLEDLSKFGNRIVGLDLSFEMLRFAKDKDFEGDLLLADGDFLPFREESFGLIVSFTVLQNLPDPKVMVGEVSRVLRPGGRAVLTSLEKCCSSGDLRGFFDHLDCEVIECGSLQDCEDVFCVVEK